MAPAPAAAPRASAPRAAALPAAEARPERSARSPGPRPVIDFGYGRCNLAAFPRAAWLRSVRRVLTGAADERLGYLDGRGAVELRSALARLPQPGAGDQRRSRDDRHHQRLRAGGVAADRSARCPRRQNRGCRGPVGLGRCPPHRARAGPERGQRAGGRRRCARGGRGRTRRRRPHPHPIAPMADRGSALPPGPGRGAHLGAADRGAGAGGRLRRRIPLRSRPDRRYAGPGPRPRRLRGDRQQDAGARVPARLAHPAAGTRRALRRGQAAG